MLHHKAFERANIVQRSEAGGAGTLQRQQTEKQGFVHEINKLLAGQNFGAAGKIVFAHYTFTSGILGRENEVGGKGRIAQRHIQALRTDGGYDVGGFANQDHAILCELAGGQAFHGE